MLVHMTTPTVTENTPATRIAKALADRGATYAWLARISGFPYKRVLAEIKHQTRPLSLEVTVATAEALDLELPELLDLAA